MFRPRNCQKQQQIFIEVNGTKIADAPLHDEGVSYLTNLKLETSATVNVILTISVMSLLSLVILYKVFIGS